MMSEPRPDDVQPTVDPSPPQVKPKKRKTARRGNGEGSIFQRTEADGTPGRWVGSVSLGYGANGKRRRRTVYGKTKKEVQDKIGKLQGQKTAGTLVMPSKMTVSQYLKTWLQDTVRLRVRPSTLLSYAGLVKREIDPRIGGLRLTSLTRLHIKRLYAEMEQAGKSARVRQMVHSVIRKALADALEDDVLPVNPAAGRKLRPKTTKAEVSFFTPEQSVAFLNAAASDRLYCLYVLAIDSGLRQGELFALRWSDIDLEGRRLSVNRTLIELNGHHSWGEPKSAKGRRQISLPDGTVAALWDHKARMMAEGNLSRSETVFCSLDGKLLRKSNVYRRSFKRILERANKAARKEAEANGTEPQLLPDIRFHDLRHTHATELLKAGAHAKVVQERLGHSQIALTMDTYSHVIESMDRAAADLITREYRKSPQLAVAVAE